MIAYLDTNVLLWLSEGKTEKLSPLVVRLIEREDLVVSPLVRLELQYLYQTKRLAKQPQAIMAYAQAALDLQVRDWSLNSLVETALYEDWTRDPFDRMIVSQARADALAPLVTADRLIRKHYTKAVW